VTRAVPQDVPSEDSRPGRIARRLARMLGPAVQAPDGGVGAAELLALGDTVDAATTQTVEAIRDESFPDTATEMLDEWEAALGLPSQTNQSAATRRASILAATRSTFGGSPADILAAIRAIVPGATLQETPAVLLPDPREVFRYCVGLGAAYDDVETRTKVSAVCTRMQPAYAQHRLVATVTFKTDDPLSLTDRDVLGS